MKQFVMKSLSMAIGVALVAPLLMAPTSPGSFRGGSTGPGPESMNTRQDIDLSGPWSWITGSRGKAPAPDTS